MGRINYYCGLIIFFVFGSSVTDQSEAINTTDHNAQKRKSIGSNTKILTMHNSMFYKIINSHFIWTVVLLVFFSSCGSVNQIKYFSDLPDTNFVNLPHLEQQARLIQKGDRLFITIGAKNPEAAAIFNNYGDMPTSGSLGAAGSSATLAMSDVSGYWVDDLGSIEFPIIGRLNAEGLTTRQLKDTITQKISPYLSEPLVSVKFISFKFTVLGEVRTPGTYILSNQRTTILDALGAAGDLPRSAKRHNIQIYRDYNGKRMIAKVDLRKKDILSNPDLFQLRNNDVVIVQPRDIQFFGEETRSYISIISLLVTSTALLISVSKR